MRRSPATNPKDYCKNNKEVMSGYAHKYTLKKFFNMDVEDYKKLLEKQENKCAICKTEAGKGTRNSRRLSVDHCHKTGKVRGLLCVNCNTVLGKVKDDVTHLQSLIKYLYENV